MDYNCAYCNISFKRNCDLTRHINSQKCKDNKVKYEKDPINGNHFICYCFFECATKNLY